jgi:CHAT domain-containing protein
MPLHAVVHLATHGFFDSPEFRQTLLQATSRSPADSGGLWFAPDFGSLEPDLMSAIVLARANATPSAGKDDNGVATALELTDLDLSKVDLVTVSACESGLGELHPSEGSLGLVRALHAAGVRTCVTSLWQVDDTATALLMQDFYTNWLIKGDSPLEALCHAQRTALRRTSPQRVPTRRGLDGLGEDARDVGSPFFWAAFTLSGDWR